MEPLFYSTGQVARQLGTTLATIRTMCENDVISSESTPGGHLRVPASEVVRLKREGLPPIPRPLPTDGVQRLRNGRANTHVHPKLLADPSDDLIESAEEVVCLENEVKSLGLRRQKEEQLDWFREREDRGAEREAQLEDAEQRREAQFVAQAQRQTWTAQWIEYSLKQVPYQAPASVRLDVHDAMTKALERMAPSQPRSTTQQLVHAAIDRALTPWRTARQVADAVKEACDSYNIPPDMRGDPEWKARMYQAARNAVGKLRSSASVDEVKAAANYAITPLVKQFEHGKACAQIVDYLWMYLLEGKTEERDQGRDAVQAALEKLPIGASRREMERARENALEPVRGIIAERQDREMRDSLLQGVGSRYKVILLSREAQQKALGEIKGAFDQLPVGTSRAALEKTIDNTVDRHYDIHQKHERAKQEKARLEAEQLQKRRNAEHKADLYLNHIERYLDDEYDFDGGRSEMRREAERLREPVREELIAELLENPNMDAEEIRECIEDLADETL